MEQIPSFDKQGHRGARGLMPENTIPAMLTALDLGVTTLEMDVVISKDRQVVVSHDPYFSAQISTMPDGQPLMASDEKKHVLYGMDYAEIRSWDVGQKPHVFFPKQQKMKAYKPLLAELVDSTEHYVRARGIKPVFYNIETKTSPKGDGILHPAPEDFVDLLMEVVRSKGIMSRTVIQSFDPRTLQVLHRKYPRVQTALLIEGNAAGTVEQHITDLGFQPSIYSPEHRRITPELIKYCHARGIRVIPWTVNDASQIRLLREMGVDGVITDYPNLF